MIEVSLPFTTFVYYSLLSPSSYLFLLLPVFGGGGSGVVLPVLPRLRHTAATFFLPLLPTLFACRHGRGGAGGGDGGSGSGGSIIVSNLFQCGLKPADPIFHVRKGVR